MSSGNSLTRRTVLVAMLGGTAWLAGCTVRPLYAVGGPEAAATGSGRTPGTIGVRPVSTRVAQEVRNQLLFLLNGGAAEPATPAYEVALDVSTYTIATTTVQRDLDAQATSGAVVMAAGYTIIDTATGTPVGSGRREINSSFDRNRQEYAALRAERDAQDRAAREMAELLRLAIAHELEKRARV